MIRVTGLSRKFGSRWALKRVSLNVSPGQICVILGHNGAGKTTLFRILLGLLRPSEGSARIAGHNTWSSRSGRLARARLGSLLESNGLYERLSAWENLELMARIYRVEATTWQRRADELLASVDLVDRKHEVVKTWSAGMKRKLALVRALVHSPDVAILDEPTAGLDAASKLAMRSLIRVARSMSCTFLISTQDLWETERMATHIAILRNGEIMHSGSYSNLCARTSLRKFRLGGTTPSEFLAAHAPAGVQVVCREEDSLGTTILVRCGNKALFTSAHDRSEPFAGGIVELPLNLEEVYLELGRQERESDDP